jgi:biopolymer transport protein ExbD
MEQQAIKLVEIVHGDGNKRMNFRRGRREDYPDINLIPFIDILLVIVIFLAVTTTYARFAELKINLPTSSAEQTPTPPKQINVAVAESGRYQIDTSRRRGLGR